MVATAVDPGWVATKMGGPGAPDDLVEGAGAQAWLAVSDDAAAPASGGTSSTKHPRETHPAVRDESFQDGLLEACAHLSGLRIPPAPEPAQPGVIGGR